MTEFSAARPCRILSLDGGGAKAFYTLGVLREIEGMLEAPLSQKFDLIFGTSTGAIIAALLALGKSVQEISDLYVKYGLVKDVTYMRALTLKAGTGELVLSRNASQVSASVNEQVVVAGTYAVAGREIYLNIRLLRPDDGEILSSADVVIPLDHNTETLFAAAN